MSKTIIIGMADLNIASNGDILTTIGLGSCVGISLYDTVSRVAGMAHIMLPNSVAQTSGPINRAKFADTAIRDLIQMMLRAGANKRSMTAKIAGGANMFSKTSNVDVIRVGERNIQSSRETLRQLGIPVIGDDTGGTYGRTILLYSENGKLLIKTVGRGESTI